MKNDPNELLVVAVILALFGAMAGLGWHVNEGRPAKLARLRDAPSISADSVSTRRIAMALIAGIVVTGASAPILMTLFPDTPLIFLVTIVLAFCAVLAPLTFLRRFTVDVRLEFDRQSLRLERAGAQPKVVDLTRPFTLDTARVDDEVLVLAEQDGARVLFSYRQEPAFVTLPLSPLPPGWLRDHENSTLFGGEAAVVHKRLKDLPLSSVAREPNDG